MPSDASVCQSGRAVSRWCQESMDKEHRHCRRIGSWPHTRTSPSSSRNNPRPRSFSCPSTAIIHQTTARFEPRRGAAIAAAFAAITTSSTSKITPHSACPASIKKKGKNTTRKMEAMSKQFARARRKGGEHRRGEGLSWRGE